MSRRLFPSLGAGAVTQPKLEEPVLQHHHGPSTLQDQMPRIATCHPGVANVPRCCACNCGFCLLPVCSVHRFLPMRFATRKPRLHQAQATLVPRIAATRREDRLDSLVLPFLRPSKFHRHSASWFALGLRFLTLAIWRFCCVSSCFLSSRVCKGVSLRRYLLHTSSVMSRRLFTLKSSPNVLVGTVFVDMFMIEV